MERHPEQNVEKLIGELEGMVYAALEQPDEVHTSLEYRLALGNGYELEFRDATGSEENNRSTAVFLFQNVEPADEHACSTRLFFSCVYEHHEDRLHGILHQMPGDDLPRQLDNEVGTVSLQKVLAVAQYIHEHGDSYQAPPRYDDEDEGVVVSKPSQGLVFEVKDEAFDSALRNLHTEVLRTANQQLAHGAYREYRLRSLGEDNGPWLNSNALSGPLEHFALFIPKLPRWSASYIEEPLEYEFEQRPDGTYEAKVSPADHVMRYGNLPSFDAMIDEETEELLCSSINEADIEQAEQIDREAGLFVPTSEQVTNFLRKLRLSLQ